MPLIIFCITSFLVYKKCGNFVSFPSATLTLFSLLLVGGVSYLMAGNINTSNLFRDFLIILNFILLYISGNWIGRTSWSSFVAAIKFSAICYGIFYLIKLFYLLSTGELDIYNTQSYRLEMGAGEFIVIIGLYFYLADLRRHSIIFPVMLLVVALLTQSRTIIIYLALMLAMYVNFKTFRTRRRFFLLFMCVQVIFASILFFNYNSFQSGPEDRHDLIGKLLGSVAEILPAYHSKSEVGYFWRGFETYIALEVFKNSSTFQFLFGRGMGFAIPLPYDMTLANNTFEELPFLHNGYATILVKFGFVGLLLYVIFLLQQLRAALKIDLRTLYTATVVFTIFATLLMAGPFEKNDFTHVTLLLGALSGRSVVMKGRAERAASGILHPRGV